MSIDLLRDKGTPPAQQKFTWKDLVQEPSSKLDDDAFTKVRIILMNGLESEAVRFSHACARVNRDLQLPLARIRRIEQHQQTLVNWLLPSDLSPLETTIAYEQTAIEVTAAIAQHEPDPCLAQVFRYGLLEDFDHLYRYAALMDRLEGKDAAAITQYYTDICPGRPASEEHRAPEDDLRNPYDRLKAAPLTKMNALTIMAEKNQMRDYYMTAGPMFADPVARQLYAEIASIEEQHVTQYESIIDPAETWLEKWLLHEAAEVYNYYSCLAAESNARIKAVWERFLDYELGHLDTVRRLFEDHEKRDAAEILAGAMPDPIYYASQRDFVRGVMSRELSLRSRGTAFVPQEKESAATLDYREQVNREGSPSELIAAGYHWYPGTSIAESVR